MLVKPLPRSGSCHGRAGRVICRRCIIIARGGRHVVAGQRGTTMCRRRTFTRWVALKCYVCAPDIAFDPSSFSKAHPTFGSKKGGLIAGLCSLCTAHRLHTKPFVLPPALPDLALHRFAAGSTLPGPDPLSPGKTKSRISCVFLLTLFCHPHLKSTCSPCGTATCQ